MNRARALAAALAIVAAPLLALDLARLGTSPLRHPHADVPSAQDYVMLPAEEALARIAAAPSLATPEARARAVTEAVAGGLVHYWPDPNGPVDTALRPRWRDGWLLRLLAHLDPLIARLGVAGPSTFTYYEQFDHRQAIARGVGLCSQAAVAVADALHQQGEDVRMVGLGGHVVATVALPEGRELLLDPDFGVVLPFGLTHAEGHLEEVAEAYRAAGHPAEVSDPIASLYGAEGNRLGTPRAHHPNVEVLYRLQQAAPVIEWLVPLALLAVSLALLRRTSPPR